MIFMLHLTCHIYTYINMLIDNFPNYLIDIYNSKFFTETMLSSYISGGGSFLGGVVGGVVAYFVARYQILHERDIVEQKEREDISNKSYMLSLEIKNHLELFEQASSNDEFNINLYKKSFSVEVWTEVKYDLSSNMTNEEFEKIVLYYKDLRDWLRGDIEEYALFTANDIKSREKLLKSILKNL